MSDEENINKDPKKPLTRTIDVRIVGLSRKVDAGKDDGAIYLDLVLADLQNSGELIKISNIEPGGYLEEFLAAYKNSESLVFALYKPTPITQVDKV